MIIALPLVNNTKELLKDCIYSITDNNKDREIEFYIMYYSNQVSKETLEEISQIANNITFIDFTNWVDIFHKASKLYGNYTTYLRLLMPRFLQIYRPEVDRFIYCDEDCYCTGDINKFYNLDFEGKEFIGFCEGKYYSCKCTEKGNSFTVNAGILLISTKFDLSNHKSLYTLDSLEYANVNKIDNNLHDQRFVNLYGIKGIYDESIEGLKDTSLFRIKDTIKEIIKFGLKNFNIAHLSWIYRGSETKLIEEGLITKQCEHKNKVNKLVTPHTKQYVEVDPTDEVICKVREYIAGDTPIQNIFIKIQ